MNRDAQIQAFLAGHGFARTRRAPLAPDASFRRYWRIVGGPRPAVLMDAPPPEDVRPFLAVGAHLAAIGLSVPEVIAAETDAGLLLLEDFGDDLFSAGLDSANAPALFDAAVDALAAMQAAPAPPSLPRWDGGTMATTALATLLDWWWPAMFGESAPAEARADFAAALDAMLAPLAAVEPVFVHRDFFIGNLMWLPEREGARRVGILDFQSAARGHPAYDLASLTQDSRRVIDPALRERCVARFVALRPRLDAAAFRDALAVCTAQRHLRVAGQWVRLARRDGKPHYLAYGPLTWRLLGQALRHPAAAPLAAAFDRWISPERRCNPPEGGP
jgi:aminoglycoside/choline kinase family phosphotransferase